MTTPDGLIMHEQVGIGLVVSAAEHCFMLSKWEGERASHETINKNSCDEWAHDFIYLQNLCRKAGYDEHAVEGDRYGILGMTDLGDMLMAKIVLPNTPDEPQVHLKKIDLNTPRIEKAMASK